MMIYVQGEKVNGFSFEQLFGLAIPTAFERFQVSQYGGGWFSVEDIADLEKIDWTKKKIYIQFTDNTTRTVDF